MKPTKILSIIFIMILFSNTLCFSQDIITKKTSETIQSKILEVTTTEIKYKNFDNQDGPIYTLPKAEISMILYENGTKDVFNEEPIITTPSYPIPKDIDFFAQGQADASKYYKGYKGAGTGTLIAGLLSPLVGLIPAVACSSTNPKEANLGFPNPELMKNADYNKAYTQKAKKIKQGKVWTNWGIAFGVNLIAVLVLSSSGQ